ncbi:hypothetical protein [Methylobacterium oxalidis]|uniref:hypothetical protein n=1 Tax=Methylobacterium oxalidis TaxID=944322 RepID=UPI00331509BB
MSETIICVAEQEPPGFHPQGARGLSVRLSVATEETDEDQAKAKIFAVLDVLAMMEFAAFAKAADGWRRLDDDEIELIAVAPDQSVRDGFKDWLAAYPADASSSPFFAQAGRDTLQASVSAAAPVERSEQTADAHDVILGMASQIAPVPQLLRLAFVLRLTLDRDLAEVENIVVVPMPAGAEIGDPAIPTDAAGEQILIAYDAPVGAGDASIRECSTTVTKPVAAPSTLIDSATGFIETGQSDPDGYAALRRFEARAGSLFSAALAAAEVGWPKPSLGAIDDEADRARRIAQFRLLTVRRLAWRAVTTLSCLLDTILIALAMPGRGKRDGGLLAPFLDLIGKEIGVLMGEGSGSVVRRADLRDSFRDGLKLLTILAPPNPDDGQGPRQTFVDALRAACGLDQPASPPANGDWLSCLLYGYAGYDEVAAWNVVEKRGAELASRRRVSGLKASEHRNASPVLDSETFAEILSRELDQRISDLHDRLTSEKGVELTILRLLGDAKVRDGFSAHLQARLGREREYGIAYDKALDQFRQRLSTDLNGADAARQAAGSLLADLLVGQAAASRHAVTVDWLTEKIVEEDFWRARFEIGSGATAFAPVIEMLARPVMQPDNFFAARPDAENAVIPADNEIGTGDEPASAIEAIDAAAARMQASVLSALFPPETARFVPDPAPRGLPVQIAVDPRDDDEDDAFSVAFAGLALLVKTRGGEWAYGNLAEVTIPRSSANPLEAPAILPLPTTLNDDRRDLFVTYDGRPFAASAFEGSVPGNENVKRRERFLTTDYPGRPAAGAKLPPLAYGVAYEVAAHAVGRSGSLPFDLQGERPWLPEHPITLPQDEKFLLRFPYSRTTAIGRVAIVESERVRRIGIMPEGVRPLSSDYPRLALSVGGPPLDLFRNPDGGGAISLPEIGSSSKIELHDVRRWSGAAGLLIDALASPNAEPGQGGLLRDDAGESVPLVIELPDHRSHTLALQITREDATQAAISVSIDGTERTRRRLAIEEPEFPLWLRLSLGGSEGAAVALADPAGSDASSAKGGKRDPEDLLLLGGGPDRTVWRQPFGGPMDAEIVLPRVSALDFERWITNPDLREALFPGSERDDAVRGLVRGFRELLLAAEIERAVRPELARLLDRLPDPAVTALEIEIAPLDGLRDEPSRLAGAGFAVRRERIAVPKIDVDSERTRARKIGLVLDDIDKAFRVRLRIKADEFAANDTRWIEPPGAANDTWTIRVPTGMTAVLNVRLLVPESHFTGTDDVPETIDRRVRQLAVASVVDTAGEACLLFEGARLRIEAMTGSLVAATEVGSPWRTPRKTWIDLVEMLVRHEPAGRARVYDLAATPPRDPDVNTETWRWRQLGSIDVATQRWRFMGRPIYSWFNLKRKLADGKGAPTPGPPSSASVRLFHDDEIEAFEEEAFEDRDDRDSELQTAVLQPFGARSHLVTVPWERPSATVFRHRFTLRVRYAGAMVGLAAGLCDAWPAREPGKELTHDEQRMEWLRIAMLADPSRVVLTRPQLRALIPLTASPEESGGRAPPVLAIIQERPFDWGGLADRVAAEIRTGVGYRLFRVTKNDTEVEVVLPSDARREIGPDPRLSYTPFDAVEARSAVLVPEGPIGLTLDDSAARAPAFPNAALVLQPGVLSPGVDPIGGAPASLEEHFLSVSLRRYLDPDWLVDEPLEKAPFDLCWWCAFEGPPARMTFESESADAPLDVLRCCTEGDFIEVTLDRSAVDPTVDTRTGAQPHPETGATHDAAPLILCRIPSGSGRLALLHMPLDERRAVLSIFLVPDPTNRQNANMRRGSGTLPILCGGIEWSIPKNFPASGFTLHPGADCEIHPMEASEATAANWVRTNRDFEAVWGSLPDREPTRIPIARLGCRSENISDRTARLTFIPLDDNARQNIAWIRARQATEPFPTHAQRHVAALLSEILPGLGRETEALRSAYLVPGRSMDVVSRPDRVRFVEFEVPAAIIGWMPAVTDIPIAYRSARFDLTAIGFDEKAGPLHLSYFARVIGSSAALRAFVSIDLKLRCDSAEPTEAIGPIRITAGSPSLAAIVLDFVVEEGICRSVTGHVLATSGTTTPITGLPGAGKVLLRDDTQGLTLSIDGAPRFSDRESHEIWLEVAMLASRHEGRGFGGRLDFDWFFGRESPQPSYAVKERDLRTLAEAQARVVAVSPPVHIAPIGLE